MNEEILKWIEEATKRGPWANEDILHSLLPLLEQVAECHEQGLVAPLPGLEGLKVDQDRLYFVMGDAKAPEINRLALMQLDPEQQSGVTVLQEWKEDDEGSETLSIGVPGEKRNAPVYLPSWVTWEDEQDHHDALSDIFCCGMWMASLACGLNLGEEEDLKRFVRNRENLFRLNPDLHPVIARVLLHMTQISRHQRLQDLPAAITLLRNYRRQSLPQDDRELLSSEEGETREQRERILSRLRERLFDISRRNRLLYFKSTLGMLGMTEASVPLRMNVQRIQQDDLFLWGGRVERELKAGKALPLGELLRFEDAPYLNGVLDRLRSEDRRNRNELGFSMMRLAAVFLRWHNLKDEKEERIHSPLLLLPVRLEKRKGVRDSYLLEPLSEEMEVNPVLRHHLDQVYGLKLPDRIPLQDLDLESFHREMEEKIQRSEPGIQLRLLTRPAIDLIHTRARKRVEVYRRRSRLSGRGIRRHEDLDYSYSPSNYQPLGLQIYLKRIKAQDWPLSRQTDATPRPRLPHMDGAHEQTPPPPPSAVGEQTLYTLHSEREANPYVWDLDACSVILANFNYRKMSLVRDYDELLEDPERRSAVFDDLFTERPRDQAGLVSELPVWKERYDVVRADPTQAQAVAAARKGQAFIIQGPPGTGKSQTITNLIADALAREQRVLFVCEKRAALDVVYYRLKQQGLEALCSLIHDSQDDKKEFIQDAGALYEHFCSSADEFAAVSKKRNTATASIQRGLDKLQRWAEELNQSGAEQLSPQQALRRLIELDQVLPELSPEEQEQLPRWPSWARGGDALRALETLLKELDEEPCLGKHPLRHLSRSCLVADEVTRHVQALIRSAVQRSAECSEVFDPLFQGLDLHPTLKECRELLAYADSVADLSEQRLGRLLDPLDVSYRDLEKLERERRHLQDEIERKQEKLLHWKQPFQAHEMEDLFALCAKVETNFLRALMPGFWKLKRLIRERYDLSQHAVKPSWKRLLDDLQARYDAEAELEKFDSRFEVDYLPGTVSELLERLRDLHVAQSGLSEPLQALRSLVLRDPLAHTQISRLLVARPLLDALEQDLSELLAFREETVLADIPTQIQSLDEALDVLPDVALLLSEFASSDEELYQYAATHPQSADEVEAFILQASLERLTRANRGLQRLRADAVDKAVAGIDSSLSELRDINGRFIVQKIHSRFRDQVALASKAASQLQAEEKAWKQRFSKGRKMLEHEFSKVMRHKSIRTLSAGDSGEVLGALKPVWLMSPLSVSDTLPLSQDTFDIVIFDEASQITLEEAVPALFRAGQAIVVGDEQQLPPTKFFGSRQEEGDAEESELLALRADSFLSHAAGTLRSTLLGWHYRSRYESLIDFSNANFYQRRLLTIPDVYLNQAQDPIQHDELPERPEVADVLSRPISFHHLPRAVYSKRRNRMEAEYIASLVLELLSRSPEHSIGIVAFSEAQQDEIEQALQRRVEEDDAARALLEEARELERDDQFVGLFVKNLENVQGDERDIIILSVCYGPDDKGKMRMNFGPINQSGGEKRLNVVFSRAKKHMVLVSGILSTAITNEYNDGANCLKRYLAYAHACSQGDRGAADRILRECCPDMEGLSGERSADACVRSLVAWLGEQGLQVDEQVGSSKFRCDVAVRGEGRYQLGLIVDTAAHYEHKDPLEQYVLRPAVLEAFGWKLLRILAKDWWEDRERVQKKILALL